MTTPDRDHDRLYADAGEATGGGGLLAGLGAGVLLILCCAAPVLIAGGIAWTRCRRRRSDCGRPG